MSIANEFKRYKRSQEFSIPTDMIIPPFQDVYEDIKIHGHREYIFSGGRGSTKSSFVSEVVIDRLKANKKMHALVLRQVKDTIKDSVYEQLKWSIDMLGLSEQFTFKKSPLEIIVKATGQKIYFRGADDPMAIKSIKPSFGFIGIVWFEELDQFHGDNVIRSILQSAIRGGDGAYVFKSFNPPKSSMNWVNKYVKMPKKSMLVTHNTYLDVPEHWLGSEFIDEAKEQKQINPKAYEHEYLGIANGTGGAVFDNVIIREITDGEIQIFDKIYRGIDWGWYPDYNRFVELHYDSTHKRLYIYKEISCRKTSNEKFDELLSAAGVEKKFAITADSSEEKSIADMRKWGRRVKPAIKGPGSVEMGIKWLCSLCEIIIDNKRCPEAANEFANYEYDKDKNGDVLSGYPDKNNHSIDAVRYALEQVWKRAGK